VNFGPQMVAISEKCHGLPVLLATILGELNGCLEIAEVVFDTLLSRAVCDG
jgi:hypothetical protein